MSIPQTLRKKRGRPRQDWMHDLAETTGKSVRAIQLDAERGEKISPAAIALIRSTHLDTGRYLDKIKNLPSHDQLATIIDDLENGSTRRKAPEYVLSPLKQAWLDAGEDERATFLTWIGQP